MILSSSSAQFPYIYRGIVKDNEDPLKIGRCRVHVPDIYGVYNYDKGLLPWARPIAGKGAKIPELEEIVWVMFEDGNKQSPVYIVGVITTKNPIDDSCDIIYEYGDCKIYYDKQKEELYITKGDSTILIKGDTVNIITENLLYNGDPIGDAEISGIWSYILIKDVN